ncbi:hypothetical protein [Chondromyces crocatus]|uniref:Uncharacterized protein n=1 Tax=Chondromyces crocatus TaxID=52 RepID=A0A0K1ECP9_CHOCO|nr:hypothetical protein [Chondromyces crocatus]AKT38646.1 uncharacterized protein CMC5_027940 [Chondromyces crocatus]
MPFDPSSLSAQARARYIRLGRSYSAHVTLAQANETLGALGRHEGALEGYGFSRGDGGRLAEVRDALVSASVRRTGEVGVRRQERGVYAGALRKGREGREVGRAVLLGVLVELRDRGEVGGEQRLVETALAMTSRLPEGKGEGVALCGQLGLLLEALKVPGVGGLAAGRGGVEGLGALEGALEGLEEGLQRRPAGGGTPEETERVYLLGGMVVTLVRQARRAARNAGRALGLGSIGEVFGLRLLDGRGRKRRKAGGSGEGGVEADGVAFGVADEGEEAVRAEAGLRHEELAASVGDAGDGAVEVAAGVEEDAGGLGRGAVGVDAEEGAADAAVAVGEEDVGLVTGGAALEGEVEDGFVEAGGAAEVEGGDVEPVEGAARAGVHGKLLSREGSVGGGDDSLLSGLSRGGRGGGRGRGGRGRAGRAGLRGSRHVGADEG